MKKDLTIFLQELKEEMEEEADFAISKKSSSNHLIHDFDSGLYSGTAITCAYFIKKINIYLSKK